MDLLNAKTLIANFCLVFEGYPYFQMMGLNSTLWYVCVLIQCYLLYYFLEWSIRIIKIDRYKYSRLICYMVIIVLSMGAYVLKAINENTIRGFVSFSIGIIICIINQKLKSKAVINEGNRNLIGVILFAFSMASCGIVLTGIDHRWVLQFFVFPLLVWSASIVKITDKKCISKLGDISFEVYSFHYPLILLMLLITEKWVSN